MNDQLHNLISQWTSLGAGFSADPSNEPIDLERLLLDTAKHTPEMSRLFIMAASWLYTYGDLIAKHRLNRLIRDDLEIEHQPTLGLLLDIAQQGTHPPEFQSVIRKLQPAATAGPLFLVERRNAKLIERAARHSSEIARKWNLWCAPIQFKQDAIRPSGWIMARHGSLIQRADFRGDLRASVLAALRFDEGAGHSEMALAERAGGSRSQVRESISNLKLTGRIQTRRAEGSKRTEIILISAA